MINKKYQKLAFAFLLSGQMSLIITLINVIKNLGFSISNIIVGFQAWPVSWMIAFPVVLIIAPITQKLLNKITI
jgi:Protein of unknown function (DUF2798)